MLDDWNDKCSPPWEPEDLATKIGNAYRYSENPPGLKSPLAEFAGVTVPPEPKTAQKAAATLPAHETITAAELATKEFAPVRFVVPGLLPEGLAILAAKPKSGKSYFALGLAIAVATGGLAFGSITCAPGDVLYCALEDGQRRLQDRLLKLMPDGLAMPSALHFKVAINRIGRGGENELIGWLGAHPEACLIVIDVWGRIKPSAPGGRGSEYDADTQAIAPLHDLAKARPGLCVLLIHHTRKMDAEDPFDTISGTLGLTGVADTLMVMMRHGEQTKLCGQGRDIGPYARLIVRDKATGGWTIGGDAREIAKTGERQAVLDVLTEAEGVTLTAGRIAAAVGKKPSTVSNLLKALAAEGLVQRPAYGKYRLASWGEAAGSPRGGQP